MRNVTDLIAIAMLCGAIAASCGCNREKANAPTAGNQSVAPKPPAGPTPESLGLGPGTQITGPDPMGRVWYQGPVLGPDGKTIAGAIEKHAYDPKTKTLYIATKEASGEWKLKERQEVTVQSLGLPTGTEEMGKDSLGRYWFRKAGQSERWAYDPKSKTLYRATQSQDKKWKLSDMTPPSG